MATTALADEGMWILSLLAQNNIQTMQQMGCKLTAEQIYSINNGSLKDAVIIFGGGCTGEIVSENGLIFTNHHCGYESIQQLSSVEHNYLKDGFWSSSFAEDLPVDGLEVRFLQSFEDVTDRVVNGTKDGMSAKARFAIIEKNKVAIIDEAQEKDPSLDIDVYDFFDDNQYFLVKYKVYTDIRLVATPPESIGKFGHDTDNWQWPRHTGDFSIFRVYAGPDNEPAAYNANNKPYKPLHFLPISIKGMATNDYAMTIGYPGSTERYLTSTGVESMIKTELDSRIEPRDIKQKIWLEDMNADQATYIQYASKYARSSNYYKNSIGMKKGISDLNVIKRKKKEEKAFNAWAKDRRDEGIKLDGILENLSTSIEKTLDANKAYFYWYECLYGGPEIFRFAFQISRLITDPKNVSDEEDAAIRKKADEFYKDYSPSTDEKVVAALLYYYSSNIDAQYYPTNFSHYKNEEDFKDYARKLFSSSLFTSKKRFYKVLDAKNYPLLLADQAVEDAQKITSVGIKIGSSIDSDLEFQRNYKRLYMKERMAMNPDKTYYSDANFTMRLSYGKVGGYKSGKTTYDYFTDLDGVMAKEDPNNWEFNVSPRLKELYNNKDYGDYADKDGKMHVCFITDNDITGGNSGSPVINGDGELIGLAFDGNWEAMSGDIIFEPDLQRCICVDIRYVLFIIDKFGGAQNIIDELTIKK